MSVVDIPAFLLDLLQRVGAPMPLQHFGEAGCNCSSSDLENASTRREGTVEEPAAAVTCGMLAFRDLATGAGRQALGSSQAASH